MIKKIIKTFIPQVLLNKWKRQLEKKQYKEWQNSGCPDPPPHIVKQIAIGEYQQKYGYTVLVETGTYLGDMIEAQKTRFKKIYSIEIKNDLFKKAQKRFINDKNVIIVLGDSGKVLPQILKDIDEPVIFWLDGHYSNGITAKGEKGCPIFEELNAIFKIGMLNHIILIDDARCFNGRSNYTTIEKLITFVKGKNEKYQVEIEHDIIRFTI